MSLAGDGVLGSVAGNQFWCSGLSIYSKNIRTRVVIYVTISYGDYGQRRERLRQAQRMQPATRFWKINSGACGRMLTGSLLALRAAKGIYHVEEAIASSTLQIAPSA